MRRMLLLSLLLVGVLGGLVATPVASAAPAPAAGERWALIVGVDRFQGGTRPNYGGVNDAADVRQALIKHGWADDHIKVLTDGAATAGAIRAGLQWLVDHSSPNGMSVFHYSGHVKQVGSTEYLWPHDNAFIADTELAGKLRQLKGQAWVDAVRHPASGPRPDGNGRQGQPDDHGTGLQGEAEVWGQQSQHHHLNDQHGG